MAEQDTKETTGPGGDNLRTVSSQYRTAAGLPERETNEPTDLSEAALEKRYEPEGGYGGREGTNTAAINATEQQRAVQRDEQQAQREEQLADTGLSGGETATEEARVTGEDVTDVKPGPGHTPEAEVVAGEDTDEEEK